MSDDYITYYKKIFTRAIEEKYYFKKNQKTKTGEKEIVTSKFLKDFLEFYSSLYLNISKKDKLSAFNSIPYVEITKIIYSLDKDISVELLEKIMDAINKATDSAITITERKKKGEIDEEIREELQKFLSKITQYTNLAYFQKREIIDATKIEIDKIKEEQKKIIQDFNKIETVNEKITAYLTIAKDGEKNLQKYNKRIEEYEDKLNEYEKRIKVYEDKLEKSTMDMLAVIGIFSTIIFAVFGGLSQLAALGGSLPSTPTYKIFIYSGITATVLSLVVFLSFYSLSKFTMLNLSSCGCKAENCSHNLIEKHPVISFSLWIFFSFIVTGFIILLMKNYIDFGFESDKFYSQEIIILMLLILPFIGVCILVKNLLFKK